MNMIGTSEDLRSSRQRSSPSVSGMPMSRMILSALGGGTDQCPHVHPRAISVVTGFLQRKADDIATMRIVGRQRYAVRHSCPVRHRSPALHAAWTIGSILVEINPLAGSAKLLPPILLRSL